MRLDPQDIAADSAAIEETDFILDLVEEEEDLEDQMGDREPE